jgi:hypothetical protein
MAFNPPPNERFVHIEWVGPFSYGPDGLVPSVRDHPGNPSAKDLTRLLRKPGLYMVYGDHPVHGDRALLYIGKATPLDRRLKEQRLWIQYEWRLEIYLSSVPQSNLDDVEKLLIYAHSPAYNSSSISDVPQLGRPIRIWNDGNFSKLYPEISSAHPWYEEY